MAIIPKPFLGPEDLLLSLQMGLPRLKPRISVEEYLEGEKVSLIRHEYLDGEIYAMSGASKRHNRIARNCWCGLCSI